MKKKPMAIGSEDGEGAVGGWEVVVEGERGCSG
jgi:hypothetical protein